MKLSSVEEGRRVRVMSVAGGDAVKRRLGALGFVAGALVRVVRISYGNMILAVHESRIAVDEATAGEIEVEAA